LNPAVCRRRFVSAGDAVIYSGGGNLVPEYRSCRRFLEHCLRVGVSAAIILPHTIRGYDSLLARLDRRFTIVCRDADSLQGVRNTRTRATTLLAPDMALRLDVERLERRCAQPSVIAAFARDLMLSAKFVDYWLWRRSLGGLQICPGSTINIIRADVEAVSGAAGDARWDISNLYASAFRSRNEADFIARDMLAFVRRAGAVRTNRLHVGIAAALVGRRVSLLDNSYGKVSAVYDTSLRHINGVSFEGLIRAATTPQSVRPGTHRSALLSALYGYRTKILNNRLQ